MHVEQLLEHVIEKLIAIVILVRVAIVQVVPMVIAPQPQKFAVAEQLLELVILV